MTATELAKVIVDSNLQVQVEKEIREYEWSISVEMINGGCRQVDVRKRFGNTKGTVYWHKYHGTKHCHKGYKQ